MNITIFYLLHNLLYQSNFLDSFIYFCAVPLIYFSIFLGFVFMLIHHDVVKSKNPFASFIQKWKETTHILYAGVSAWILAEILKYFIHTPRPFEILSGIKPLFVHGGMDSFPSGHATVMGALAFSVLFAHKKVGYFFVVLALLVGMARVASGVHFPIDILGGYVLGCLVAYFTKRL